MSDPLAAVAEPAAAPPGITAILEWLGLPASGDLGQELATLKGHLLSMAHMAVSTPQRQRVLELVYGRSLAALAELTPTLDEAALPLPRRLRNLVKALQDLQEQLARDLLAVLQDQEDEHLLKGLRQPPEVLLWRAQHLLRQHLLISALVASPAAVGIWALVHRACSQAREREVQRTPVPDSPTCIEDEYAATLLLACAQPASFTARELEFVAAIAERHGRRLEFLSVTDERHRGLFWIDPSRDMPAVALARRLPPPETQALWFSCDQLAHFLERQLHRIDTSEGATVLELPEFAASLSGRSVLRRLIRFWGNPARRRFPRRRQSYRVALYAGLEPLTGLLREAELGAGEGSSWMITNESPDGYALMHLSGSAEGLEVGDVVALKPESLPPGRNGWQACMVRWALSENPEHLEIGLQILAPRALPATVALSGDNPGAHPHVLVLPAVPGLRSGESLVAPAGLLPGNEKPFVLLVEKENLEIREVRTTSLDEQTARVEIHSIATAANPE